MTKPHDRNGAAPMTRQRFLKLAAAAGGVLAAEGLLGPVDKAFAQSGPVYDPAITAKPVQTRPIPSSGEQLPIIGMGTAVVYEIEISDPKFPALVESVRAFLNGGGKLIDTAPTYGRAEENLGEIFKRTGLRDKAFLATKISMRGNNQEKEGIAQYEGSVKNLGTNRFELLQVHNIRDWKVQLKTIRRVKDEGKVKYVGITTSFENTYQEYEQILRTEKLDFAQIDYALDNRKAEARILPLAKDRGVTVLTALPFGRNRLLAQARGKEIPEWAKKELEVSSWAQYFLKYLLGNPAIGAVIPGTDRPEYAVDNLYAGRGRIPNEQQRQRMVADWEKLAG
jgi:aryl-alcohol dehydrogenase-like predicted oxidoreductase